MTASQENDLHSPPGSLGETLSPMHLAGAVAGVTNMAVGLCVCVCAETWMIRVASQTRHGVESIDACVLARGKGRILTARMTPAARRLPCQASSTREQRRGAERERASKPRNRVRACERKQRARGFRNQARGASSDGAGGAQTSTWKRTKGLRVQPARAPRAGAPRAHGL